MKKQNIFFFIPTLGQGGAEKVFLNLANEMVKNHNVSFILQDTKGVLFKDLNNGIKIHNIGFQNKLKLLFKILSLVSKKKPDVIISTLTIPNILNAIVHKASFHKYILITRQAAPILDSNRKIINILLTFSFRRSKVVIANSFRTKESISNNMKLKNNLDNVQVIYNPIFNLEMYEKANESIQENTFDYINDKFILSVGRLEQVKDFKLLIKSFGLSQSKNKLKLVILGEGSQRNEIELLIQKLNLNNEVHLLGSVSNPYPFYKNAEMFVSSSKWEGFGNVIVEALSFGLPIIYTKYSGAPKEILKDNEYGWGISKKCPIEMSNLIDTVYNKKNYNKTVLIERAKEFSVEKISLQYESTFT